MSTKAGEEIANGVFSNIGESQLSRDSIENESQNVDRAGQVDCPVDAKGTFLRPALRNAIGVAADPFLRDVSLAKSVKKLRA
jgi:hypothetical protein